MSTKIYDAYKIKCGNIRELREFRKDLTKLYYEYCYKIFIQYCAVKVLSLTERLPFEANRNQERADGIIKTIGSLVDSRRMSIREPMHDTKNIDFELAANNLKDSSVIDAATRAAMSMIEIAENDKYGDYRSVKASFAVYEYPTKQNVYSLIMGFGNLFTRFLSDIYNNEDNPAYTAFREKWNFVDYHYQNQTDRPDEISDREWNRRESVWDEIMDTSVPREDAVIVNMYSADQFDHDLTHMCMFDQPSGSKYYDKITNDVFDYIINNTSERAHRNGYEDAIDKLISEHPDFKACNPKSTERARIVSRLSREFKKLYDENDPKITNLVKECVTDYEAYMLDFKNADLKEELKTKNIFDFTSIQSYSGFMKSEQSIF